MTIKKKSLVVLVIALKNSSVGLKTIGLLSKFVDVEIIEAATPNSLLSHAYKPAKGVEPIEMAISVSHHLARLRAKTLSRDWTLILEEDVIIKFEIEELLTLIEEIDSYNKVKIPLGIHLFPEQFGILTMIKNRGFLHVNYLPDCAVGYCLNLLAIEKTVQDFRENQVEIADWPSRIRKNILWFAPNTSLVAHPDLRLKTTKSSTSEYRKKRKNLSLYRKLLKFKIIPFVLIKIGHILNLKFGENPVDSEKIRSVKLQFKC